MAERIYVVGGPTGIHLVNSSTKQGAIAYVPQDMMKVIKQLAMESDKVSNDATGPKKVRKRLHQGEMYDDR